MRNEHNDEQGDDDGEFSDEELIIRPKGRLEEPPPSSQLPVVLLAFAVCVAVSMLSWNTQLGLEFSASTEVVFGEGKYWRLLTALAAHADWEHLLGNAPLFIIFGWLLRSYFGLWFFPILPLLAGVLANLCTILWYEPWQRLLGCSGMVYAMVAIWLVLYLRFEVRYTLPMRIFRCVGFTLILLFPSSFHPTTSYLAHTLGFVFGVVLALFSVRFIRED
jgi:rhomboid protease GluP